MKRDIISLVVFVLMSMVVFAQNDTMYIMKDGIVIHKQCITPENVDSIIFYQPEVQFGTVSDIDGNVYPTLQLGGQEWMAANLRVTHYPDGMEIPFFESDEAKDVNNSLGDNDRMCWYDDNIDNKPLYGGLYTLDAAMNACPKGWHLPSDDEWKVLEAYLDMPANEIDNTGYRGTTVHCGARLAGSAELWIDGALESFSGAAFGNTGFNTVPGGERNGVSGEFSRLGEFGTWWSDTYFSNGRSYVRVISYDNTGIDRRGNINESGYSVRCLKD